MAFNRTLAHFTSSQELATEWASGQSYITGQIVIENNALYKALIGHTSGLSFATDLAAGKWVAIESSGGGDGKNYIENPDFDGSQTTNWAMRKVSLSSLVPTGNIGAADAGHTIAASSSSPLEGANSLLVQGASLFTAGNCLVSDAFAIDRQDQAKVMGWSFYYEAVTANMDFPGTSAGTWAVYIAEVTTATPDTVVSWIQPAGVYNLVQSSGAGIASGTFQTTAAGTAYRLVLVCINSEAAATTLKVDNFQLGPQKVLQGPSGPVGEIISTGSLTPPVGFLYCDGTAVSRTNYSDLFIAIGTTYGVGDGSTTFNLPDLRGVFARGAGSQSISGITYSGTLGAKQGDQMQGHYHSKSETPHTHTVDFFNGGLATQNFNGGTDGPTLRGSRTSSGANSNLSVTSPSTDGTNGTPRTGSQTHPANVAVAYHIRYLATYQMSQDTDTRVVAMSASGVGGAVTANVTNIPTTTTTLDTHGSWSGSIYTVPVSGNYQLFGSGAGPSNASFFAYIDGVSTYEVKVANGTNASGAISYVLPNLRAGQTISIRSNVSQTLTNFALAITRISGPATIAASETVAMARAGSVVRSVPVAGAYLDFDNASGFTDTHGAWRAGSGYVAGTGAWSVEPAYVVPVSGIYSVSVRILLGSTAGFKQLFIRKNGSTFASTADDNTFAGNFPLSMHGQIKCNAGDLLQVFFAPQNAQNAPSTVSNFWTGIEISRVGN